MIPFAIPAAVLGFGKSWWKAAVGAAAVFPLAFLLGQCDGRARERDRADAAQAVATQAAMRLDAGAQAAAADERLKDQSEVANLTEELTDAVAQAPDSVPAPAAVALGCERLRQAGRDVSALPSCSRP